jgi:hypothetical protein
MSESPEATLLRLCRLLSKHGVEYLIVGGAAVAIYGHYRMSLLPSGEASDKYDFDFWYNPTYANYYRLLEALGEFGIDVTKYKNEQEPNPRKSFFKHGLEDFTLDFLPEILGPGRFADSFRRKSVSTLEGVEIYTVALSDLILSKQATNREKDRQDIAALQALHKPYDADTPLPNS